MTAAAAAATTQQSAPQTTGKSSDGAQRAEHHVRMWTQYWQQHDEILRAAAGQWIVFDVDWLGGERRTFTKERRALRSIAEHKLGSVLVVHVGHERPSELYWRDRELIVRVQSEYAALRGAWLVYHPADATKREWFPSWLSAQVSLDLGAQGECHVVRPGLEFESCVDDGRRRTHASD